MTALHSRCACGAATVTVPRRPKAITDCNCSICTKFGTTWAYYPPDELEVDESQLESFVRPDMREPWLRMFRCRACGCVTHWRLIRPLEKPRSGVNVQLFEPADIEGIEIRHTDGRSWPVE